jgi:H+/Cl- antiporter ClcA
VRAQLRAAREVARQDPAWLRTWYWPLLLSVLVVGFTFGETIALVNRGSGGTATERVKAALGVDPPRRRRRVAVASFVASLLAAVVWLIPHMTHWPLTWPWE